MDFFLSADWLHQGGSYWFRWDHLLFVFLFIGLGILSAILLRKKDKKFVHKVLIILYVIATVTEMSWFIVKWVASGVDPVNHPFLIDYMIPLHSCFVFMYICPFALFSKNKIIRTASSNFIVIVNMIMGFITLFVGCPIKGYSALSFGGFISIFYHALIVIIPLIMIVTKYYDIKKEDIKYGLSLFGILALAVYIFDVITKADYFYLYDGHCFGILYEISEHVPHIVWTLIVVSCYVITAFIVHFFVVSLKWYLINKKK